MDFLNKEFFNNSVLDYLVTLIVIIVGVFIMTFFKMYVFHRVKKKAVQAKLFKTLLDSLGKTLIPAIFFGIIYLSIQHLKMSKTATNIINIAGITIVTFLGIKFVTSILRYALEVYWNGQVDEDTKKKNIKSVMPIVKIVAYGLGIFFLLDNLGFNVSTLLAGLGIGGVAVALAGQAILADLFSYFAILFDKPFEIGDFIIVDQHMGVVEKTGIKTTRIKSLSGEQLVFSNKTLTDSAVRNYKRMQERRVLFRLGVIYQTTAEQLKAIPEIIKKIIEDIEDARFDRAHFFEYGDFSLNFEIVYYIFGADYNKYMDIHQQINLQIFEGFANRGIEFAYPTQTLFVEKASA